MIRNTVLVKILIVGYLVRVISLMKFKFTWKLEWRCLLGKNIAGQTNKKYICSKSNYYFDDLLMLIPNNHLNWFVKMSNKLHLWCFPWATKFIRKNPLSSHWISYTIMFFYIYIWDHVLHNHKSRVCYIISFWYDNDA